MLVCLPTPARALNARLRWAPSPDARVQGYYIYLRQATRPYGSPLDVGAPRLAVDGSIAWVLTGLDSATTYFVAVAAYNADRQQSVLSNELAIGTPNTCVRDACTTPTQCVLQTLPDGFSCGPAGGACGGTCQSGTCSGLPDRLLMIDRLRLKGLDTQLRIVARGRFPVTSLFDPGRSGLRLVFSDAAGSVLSDVILSPADLSVSGDGTAVKAIRRRDRNAAAEVRRLLIRSRPDETRFKASVIARPGLGTLPTGAALTLQSGELCLPGAASRCTASRRTLSCR